MCMQMSELDITVVDGTEELQDQVLSFSLENRGGVAFIVQPNHERQNQLNKYCPLYL